MSSTSSSLGKRRERLLTEPVSRVLFDLSWPMSLGLFSVIVINVTDTFYIGRLGADELAAIGFCFPVIFGMSAIAIGMGNGGAAVVSRAIGAGEEERARELVVSTLLFTLVFAVGLTFLMLRISDAVFLALGAPEPLLFYINQFMTVWYLGLPLLVLPIVLNGLIRASGEAKVPSFLMVLAAFINAAISPFIIFGLLGFPALGMKGAAIATLVARFVIVSIAIRWLLKNALITFQRDALGRFGSNISQVLRYGAPAFLAQLASPIAMATVTRLLASSGPDTVAGFAVGSRIESLALIPFFALQTGVTPFIGQNVGAGEQQRLGRAEKNVWAFALLWGGLGAAVMVGFGGDLVGLFTDNPAIVATGDRYLEALSIGFWGAGLLTASIGVFNPLGYPNVAFGVNAIRFVVFYAGISAAGVFFLGWEPERAVFTGAWVSFALAGLIAAGLMRFLLLRPNMAELRPTAERSREKSRLAA